MILAVTLGDLASVFDRAGRMTTGKAQQAHKDPHAFDPASLNHRLSPDGALRPSRVLTLQEPTGAFSTPLIFFGSMNSGGVLKPPGSFLGCTAICSIRSL